MNWYYFYLYEDHPNLQKNTESFQYVVTKSDEEKPFATCSKGSLSISELENDL